MTNVNKPVIPAEVADAIEEARKHHNEADLFQPHAFDSHSEHYEGILGRWVYASDENLRDYFTALINGFERELTEEQECKRTYTEIARTHRQHCEGSGRYATFPEDYAFADGIRYTLDMLGIDVLESI